MAETGVAAPAVEGAGDLRVPPLPNGNPNPNAVLSAMVKTLTGSGPLPLAQEHMVIKMLPDAFDKTSHAPSVTAIPKTKPRSKPSGDGDMEPEPSV